MNQSDLQYYRKINRISKNQSCKDLLINEITQDYNNARDNTIYRFNVLIGSNDAKDVYINGSDTFVKGIIDVKRRQTADTEMEESIQVYPNQIKRGDYLKFKVNDTDELRDYIITSKIEKKHGYDEGIFKECNHLLKWMYKGELYETMSITSNATKYTEGTKAIGESIVEIQARYSAIIPYNNKTKTISIGTRFIINNIAWEVTQTDFTTDVGLLVLTLGKSSINTETDNLDLGVADYYIVKHDYKFDIPSNFNVTKDDSIKLVYSIQDNLKDINYDLVEIEYNGSLIQITKDNKDITILGKELGTGTIKLKVNLTNEIKEFNITFNVLQVAINEIKYDIQTSNGYTYRIKEGSTITAIKYVNGVVQNNLIIECQLDSNGQTLLSKNNISIVKKTDSSFTIRNLTINALTTFYLTVVDKTTGYKILSNQIITLKGI